jgi:hypothetical protein
MPDGHRINLDDSAWQRIGLPHTFDLPYFRTPEFYVGYGWYRKRLDLPEDLSQRRIFLEFEGVFQEAEIHVNGSRVDVHRGGYTGFYVDISDHAMPRQNLLAIRVNNLWNPQLAPRAGEHIFSGGIYRDVRLVIKSDLHLRWHGVQVRTPTVSRNSAVVELETEVCNSAHIPNEGMLASSIVSPAGEVIAQVQSAIVLDGREIIDVKQPLPEIDRPQLWQPDHPSLYSVHSQLFVRGVCVDETSTPFGIRWFEWTKDKGFFLNGEHLYLRGANLHQDQSGWGIGITHSAIRRDVQLMKDAGFNFIRGAHYPHHPAFSQACDELGMLLWCELPFWGKGGFGPAGYWNSSAYPANEKDFEGFEQSCINALVEMIRIHRNHPSIIAWSMTNEAFFTYNIEEAKNLIRKLVDFAHQLDPTRPAAIGGAQRGGFDQLGDLAGYNGDGAKLFIDPGVPNMVSEYGAISKPPNAYEPFFGDLQKERLSWRSGEAIWCGADYGTIAGKQGLKGIVDHARVPKRSWHWYRNAYRGIAPPGWPGKTAATHLKLESSAAVIHGTEAIEDVQLAVSICDAQDRIVDAAPRITLTIESGPGEFPTGRSITFDPATDITFSHGTAAIAFRSYEGGESVIRATSPGLRDATTTITTIGEPRFISDDLHKSFDRPYVPPAPSEACLAAMKSAVNVARDRPCRASSEDPRHPSRLANDADDSTHWQATREDLRPFWQVDLEGFYQLSSLRIAFPHAGNYRFLLDVSMDGITWQQAIDRSASANVAQVREDVFAFGIVGRYVRVTCVHNPAPEPFGVADLALFGVLSLR